MHDDDDKPRRPVEMLPINLSSLSIADLDAADRPDGGRDRPRLHCDRPPPRSSRNARRTAAPMRCSILKPRETTHDRAPGRSVIRVPLAAHDGAENANAQSKIAKRWRTIRFRPGSCCGWSDFDMMAHVNNVQYMRFFECGVVEFFAPTTFPRPLRR